MLRGYFIKNFSLICSCIIFITSLNFLACQPDEKIKKISIRSQHSAWGEKLEGEVVSLNNMGEYTRITLNSGELDISPPVDQWPKQFKIHLGEKVSLSSRQTIGNRSQSLSVWNDGEVRLRIVQGAFSPILIPGNKVRYYVKAGDPIDPDPNSPRISASLVLTLQGSGDIFVVKPGDKVNLGEWGLYLIRLSHDNPDFPDSPGIAKERASLDFDYILYRNK